MPGAKPDIKEMLTKFLGNKCICCREEFKSIDDFDISYCPDTRKKEVTVHLTCNSCRDSFDRRFREFKKPATLTGDTKAKGDV
jgi:hypothetical protein